MNQRWMCALLCALVVAANPPAAAAQDSLSVGTPSAAEPTAAAPSVARTASITNPNISVIGWFQGVSGNDPTLEGEAFELKEAELAFQAAVDPFAKADFFMSASPEGLEVEEGYITWLALLGGLQAKVGKFRADLGKFNRTHPPETPFADRPLAAERFLGEEGLATTGVNASYVLPAPASVYWDVVGTVGVAPDSTESPLFQPDTRSDVLTLGRTSAFFPIGESADINLGISYANSLARPDLRVEGNRAQVGVFDLTMHWKNPRHSIYRSLLAQVEVLSERGSGEDATTRHGSFGYVIYQFARQWKAGVRADVSESPGSSAEAKGVLGLLGWQPSEFSTLSLQARRVRESGEDLDAAFFKWTFNIGPHGAHPY